MESYIKQNIILIYKNVFFYKFTKSQNLEHYLKVHSIKKISCKIDSFEQNTDKINVI